MGFLKIKAAVFSVLCLWAMTGCSMNIVPSQYDLKLKAKMDTVTIDVGGASSSLEVTVDSRRYQDLSSDQNIFLSYHLLSESGEMLTFDNERTMLEPIDARGIKTETLNFTAPGEAGNYILQIDLVEEGVTWFSEQGMPTLEISLTVLNTYIPPYAEIALSSETKSLKLLPSDEIILPITIVNSGSLPLYAAGPCATRISYHIKDNDGNILLFDGVRTALKAPLNSGDTTETQLKIKSDIFDSPGNYIISIDLVIEGVSWYEEKGMKALDIPVIINRFGD